MVTIYGIKNCDSVKKALKFLKNHAIEYTFVDLKEHPPSLQKIKEWLQHADIDTLFNARSTTYRNLKLKELTLDDVQKVQWLAKEPLLIKRPVIESDDTILVGFNEARYTRRFL